MISFADTSKAYERKLSSAIRKGEQETTLRIDITAVEGGSASQQSRIVKVKLPCRLLIRTRPAFLPSDIDYIASKCENIADIVESVEECKCLVQTFLKYWHDLNYVARVASQSTSRVGRLARVQFNIGRAFHQYVNDLFSDVIPAMIGALYDTLTLTSKTGNKPWVVVIPRLRVKDKLSRKMFDYAIIQDSMAIVCDLKYLIGTKSDDKLYEVLVKKTSDFETKIVNWLGLMSQPTFDFKFKLKLLVFRDDIVHKVKSICTKLLQAFERELKKWITNARWSVSVDVTHINDFARNLRTILLH